MFFWIFAFIVTMIGYTFFALSQRFLKRHHRLKDPTIKTPLKEFPESHRSCKRIKKTTLQCNNVSEKYERMCMISPREYQDDPEIPKILQTYKKIISGEIPDPKGEHMPSEFILGARNPDYDTYIENQKEALRKVGTIPTAALEKESARLRQVNHVEDMRSDLTVELIRRGIPPLVLEGALSPAKLDSFSAQDYNTLAELTEQYAQQHGEKLTAAFVQLFEDKEVLFNEEKMEQFAVYSKHGAPIAVVKLIVEGAISADQAVKMLALVDRRGYEWDEAVERVTRDTLNEEKERLLRDHYRQQTR